MKQKRFEVTQKRTIVQARILEVYAANEDEAAEIADRQGEIVDGPFVVENDDWEIIDIELG